MTIPQPSKRPGVAEGLPRHELLTPAEVARIFRVDPKSVTRWAKKGLLPHVRTLGGHRRYRAAEIRRILDGGAPPLPVREPGAALKVIEGGAPGHTVPSSGLVCDAAAVIEGGEQ